MAKIKVLKTTFKLHRKTANDWILENPLLLEGEPGFEIDTFKLKIGDGILPWAELPYVNSNEDIYATKEELQSKFNIVNNEIEELAGKINGTITTIAEIQEIISTLQPIPELVAELGEQVETAVDTAEKAELIAKGRAAGYVFNTKDDLDEWLEDEDNISKLNLGDNLYIREINVSDYWWDGESIQKLETEKPDFTGYVKNTDYATSTTSGVLKTGNGLFVSNAGVPSVGVYSLTNYNALATGAFLSKGTLNNIFSSKFNSQFANVNGLKVEDLGEIDLDDYDGDVNNFLDTLTSYGFYRFVDSYDNFHHFLKVETDADEDVIGQIYWSSEEGIEQISYRSAFWNDDEDEYQWRDWENYLTYSSAVLNFAQKNHSHFTNKSFDTESEFWDWMEKFNAGDDYRITIKDTQKFFMVSQFYINFSTTPKKYVRCQKYWEISEPWTVYSRSSVNTTTTLKWGSWYASESYEV